MLKDEVVNDYFEWLYNTVCGERYSENISFRKLLSHLHSTTFTYSIKKDENRACDGEDLRYRFAITNYSRNSVDMVMRMLSGPCSVLEMMTALAIKCEETIMDDPLKGNRTGQWFWGMITNLGLGDMYDDRYDKKKVNYIITRFLNRDYRPDGKGGLFTVKGCERDLRNVEIWCQLCWYLDTIT